METHPERWIRVWFTTTGTYSEVGWSELTHLREAYRKFHEQGQDTELSLTAISGGTLIVMASKIECMYLLDQDSWREGLAQGRWQEKVKKEVDGEWG